MASPVFTVLLLHRIICYIRRKRAKRYNPHFATYITFCRLIQHSATSQRGEPFSCCEEGSASVQWAKAPSLSRMATGIRHGALTPNRKAWSRRLKEGPINGAGLFVAHKDNRASRTETSAHSKSLNSRSSLNPNRLPVSQEDEPAVATDSIPDDLALSVGPVPVPAPVPHSKLGHSTVLLQQTIKLPTTTIL